MRPLPICLLLVSAALPRPIGAAAVPPGGAERPLALDTLRPRPMPQVGHLPLSLTASGRHVATGDFGGTVLVWDVEPGVVVRRLEAHSDAVSVLAFSPDGTRLLSGGWDGTIVHWDVASGEPLATLEAHDSHVAAVRFLPDGGRAVSAGGDQLVRWDLETGTELLAVEEPAWVSDVAGIRWRTVSGSAWGLDRPHESGDTKGILPTCRAPDTSLARPGRGPRREMAASPPGGFRPSGRESTRPLRISILSAAL